MPEIGFHLDLNVLQGTERLIVRKEQVIVSLLTMKTMKQKCHNLFCYKN